VSIGAKRTEIGGARAWKNKTFEREKVTGLQQNHHSDNFKRHSNTGSRSQGRADQKPGPKQKAKGKSRVGVWQRGSPRRGEGAVTQKKKQEKYDHSTTLPLKSLNRKKKPVQ